MIYFNHLLWNDGSEFAECYVLYYSPKMIRQFNIDIFEDGKLKAYYTHDYYPSTGLSRSLATSPDLDSEENRQAYMEERLARYLKGLQTLDGNEPQVEVKMIYRMSEEVDWAALTMNNETVPTKPANQIVCVFTVIEETSWAKVGEEYILYWDIDYDEPVRLNIQSH